MSDNSAAERQAARRAYQAVLSRLEQAIAARIAKAKPRPRPNLWRRIGRALGARR